MDTVIAGGTGAPPVRADAGIGEGRIAAIGGSLTGGHTTAGLLALATMLMAIV